MLNENTDMFSDILDEFDDDDSDISFNLIYAIIERLHALQESHKYFLCMRKVKILKLNIINGTLFWRVCNAKNQKPSRQQKKL